MKIVKYPHLSLRYKSRPVTTIDKELRVVAGQMLELMYEHRGLGLAGPQVMVPQQLLVLNFAGDPEQKDQEMIAVNPVILAQKGVQDDDREGCLSFPDLFQKVRRAKTITVRCYTIDGQLHEATYSDLSARLWLHEVDHLNGVLFIDKMGPLQRMGSRLTLRDFENRHRESQRKGDIPSDAVLRKQLDEFNKTVVL